jgi:hypothetical protein
LEKIFVEKFEPEVEALGMVPSLYGIFWYGEGFELSEYLE